MRSYLLMGAIGASLFSCNQTTNSKNSDDLNVDPKLVWESGTLKDVFVENGDSTVATIQYAFLQQQGTLKKLSDSLIVDFLTETKEFPSVDVDFFKKELNVFMNERKEYAKEDFANNFPWELDVKMEFDNLDDRYVKARFETYSFMGGAHGNHFVKYHMLDVKDNKELKLTSLFTNLDKVEKLVAEPIFRQMVGLNAKEDYKKLDIWFENNQFHLNNNFFFDEENIVFLYNNYEIGPYANGQYELVIPLSKVEKYRKF